MALKTFTTDMKKNTFLLIALIAAGILLKWVSQGIPTLDARFSYSSYEALGFLAELSPIDMQRLRVITAIDLLLFIPIYSVLFYRLTALEYGRKFQLVLLTVGITADVFETILEFLGTHEVGWVTGWLPQLLSLSTPTKWIALGLWGISAVLLFLRRRFG